MAYPIQKITEKIKNGSLLGVSTFADLDTDSAIEEREQPEFEAEWMHVYNVLQQETFKGDQKKEIDHIRELSFKKTYEHTSDPNLAAFVSDDFEILCQALVAGFEDPWLNGLFQSYLNQVFPSGTLTEYSGKMAELL